MKKKIFILFLAVVLLVTNVVVSASALDKNSRKSDKIILIDPGHGGIDGGAKSKNGTIEKDINLAIGLKLRAYLEKKGYKIFMTRADDTGLYEKGKTLREKKDEDLGNRVKLKESTKCNIFVSIHQNMFPQSKYYGAQTWYASDEESKKLGELIQNTLVEKIDKNNKRVAKSAGDDYRILRDKLGVPSVIVECGFLSNPNEEALLKTDEYQQKLADTVGHAIDKYFQSKNDAE